MKTRITTSAYSDLKNIHEFIAEDSPISARETIERIAKIIDQCSRMPFAGRVVLEYDDPNLRERIWGSYRIIYRVLGGVLEVVAVYHTARELKDGF